MKWKLRASGQDQRLYVEVLGSFQNGYLQGDYILLKERPHGLNGFGAKSTGLKLVELSDLKQVTLLKVFIFIKPIALRAEGMKHANPSALCPTQSECHFRRCHSLLVAQLQR
jgi:hypothetical protein